MKVSVVGAGAIGTMLGGLIQHHDPNMDVVLVVRGEHGDVVQRQGHAVLEGPWGRHRVPVRASLEMSDIEGSDFVLLTVKSQGTREAVESAKPFLGNATVVSIQNGINEPRLAPFVEAERLVMAVTATNMAIVEPGRVSLQLNGKTLLGPNASRSNQQAVQSGFQLLEQTGLPVEMHPNIDGVRYNKLAINAVGYASCLSASNFISEALADRDWRRYVGRGILDECLNAFQRAGIQPHRIAGTPSLYQLRRVLAALDFPLVGSALELGARKLYDKKPIIFSLYQDLKRGKITEVDYVNGEIVRLAEANGRAAPNNRLVAEMVHELEQDGSPEFLTRGEVVERFQKLHRTL